MSAQFMSGAERLGMVSRSGNTGVRSCNHASACAKNMIMQDLTPFALFHRLGGFFPGLKRWLKRSLYDAFSRELRRRGLDGIRLLNYGCAYPDARALPFELEAGDQREYPYSWNLVYETVGPVGVAGKKVLVIGCGRGGDAHFIHRYLNAAAVIGVDSSQAGIEACRRAYPGLGLEFRVGDAERLDFQNGSFDAVVNIESSHCYAHARRFYREARRVLAPGGAFLYCDYFWDGRFRGALSQAGWEILQEEEITEGVLRACREGQILREELIRRLAPASLHRMLREWCALPGSTMYRSFEQRRCRYYRFLLRPTSPNTSRTRRVSSLWEQ